VTLLLSTILCKANLKEHGKYANKYRRVIKEGYSAAIDM
jgi:hypothetical protein